VQVEQFRHRHDSGLSDGPRRNAASSYYIIRPETGCSFRRM
jgi:hypothetical protein